MILTGGNGNPYLSKLREHSNSEDQIGLPNGYNSTTIQISFLALRQSTITVSSMKRRTKNVYKDTDNFRQW
jgi:hypothetical protein